MPIKNDPQVFAKERKVLELRQMGITFDVIAEEAGYASPGSAYNAYKRALLRTLQEPADQIREFETARLDRLISGVWEKALNGEIPAIMAVLKILERRAKLLGLDAPSKVQQEVTIFEGGSEIDAEVRRLAYLIAENRNNEIGPGSSLTPVLGEASEREPNPA